MNSIQSYKQMKYCHNMLSMIEPLKQCGQCKKPVTKAMLHDSIFIKCPE